MQKFRFQPFPLIAQSLVRGAQFLETLRSAVGREVSHQSQVAAPDFGIAGIVGHAENGERVAHQKKLRRRPPSDLEAASCIAFAIIAAHSSRSSGSGSPGPTAEDFILPTNSVSACSRPSSLTRFRRLATPPWACPS